MTEKTASFLPRNQRGHYYFIEKTLTHLCNYFLRLNPDKDAEAFQTEIVSFVANVESACGDKLLEESRRLTQPGGSGIHGNGTMLISCAYLKQSSVAFERGDFESAWSFMADATFWCGMATASAGIEKSRVDTIIKTRQHSARSGGLAKSKKDLIVKEKAFELARLRCPKEGFWKSRSFAANKLSTEVFEFIKTQPNLHSFSENNLPKRLFEWFGEMPDAHILFRGRARKD